MKLFVIFFLLCKMSYGDAAKILAIVPTASFSHQQFYRPYLVELHKRGHHLTIATANPIRNSSMANYREINLDYGYKYLSKILGECFGQNKVRRLSFGNFLKFALKFSDVMCDVTLSDDNLMSVYKNNEKFDLVILEWGLTTCFLPFGKLSDEKVIGIASYEIGAMTHLSMGNPSNPAHVPDPGTDLTDYMSFSERVISVISYVFTSCFLFYLKRSEYNIAKKYFGPDMVDPRQIEEKVTLVFDNSHPVTGYPRSANLNFIPLGGPPFHMKNWEKKVLPKDIKDFMDNAEHGVIYFSLGTNVKTALGFQTEEKILIECFSRIKQRVLWKWENENVKVNLKNVQVSKWFPQADILAHPNVKAFVTQGGLQSIGEAIEYRVPMIAMPFFADQGHNAMKLKSVGVAIFYEFENLNVEDFTKALNDIVYNSTYKENMIKYNELVNDQIMPPLEKAVWWTEYVIRHNGAPHLRSIAATMPWYQYFMLDVLGTLLLAIILFLYAIYFVMRTLAKLVFFRKKKKI